MNFWGGNAAHQARVGAVDTTQSAEVLDSGLSQALGRSSVTINLNLPEWVIIDPTPRSLSR